MHSNIIDKIGFEVYILHIAKNWRLGSLTSPRIDSRIGASLAASYIATYTYIRSEQISIRIDVVNDCNYSYVAK